MNSKLKLMIAALALALPACSHTLSAHWPDAVNAEARFTAPVMTASASGTLTGRAWNCRACYK